ncbi:MAG: four helix bundle protein [Gemmatimonadaceae bacterium]
MVSSECRTSRNSIIRAAMSIPANSVEGREQASEKDFARFLRYSIGSASELEYHLIIGRDMELISQEVVQFAIREDRAGSEDAPWIDWAARQGLTGRKVL